MAALTVNQIAISGLAVGAFAAPGAAGDTFANTGKEYVELRTAGTASTVTFQTPLQVSGQAVADLAIVTQATGTVKVGPFSPNLFNDGGGLVNMSYNGTAGLTIGVFRLPV